MLNFFRPKPDSLMYGRKVCPRNHTDMQDRVVRCKTGVCWACRCQIPDGKFNFDFGDLPEQVYQYHGKYKTDEEKHQARIDAQTRWYKRNYEKCREYQRKYESKPEIKEKRSRDNAAKYIANRDKIMARNRAYAKEYYQRKKNERNNSSEQKTEGQELSS